LVAPLLGRVVEKIKSVAGAVRVFRSVEVHCREDDGGCVVVIQVRRWWWCAVMV